MMNAMSNLGNDAQQGKSMVRIVSKVFATVAEFPGSLSHENSQPRWLNMNLGIRDPIGGDPQGLISITGSPSAVQPLAEARGMMF